MSDKLVLIMGLPGSGKTTLAGRVFQEFADRGIICNWLNADKIRRKYDDWDFSPEGRIRAATRMRELVDKSPLTYALVDMVSPTAETRKILNPDLLVWMNTIKEGRFEDTNEMFQPPRVDMRDTFVYNTFGSVYDARAIVNYVTEEYSKKVV